MGYATNYTGPSMDTNLDKGRNISAVSNGYIKLTSTDSAPVDLNILKNPGNYTVDYCTNTPSLPADVTSIIPFNITVISVNSVIYQFVFLIDTLYSRYFNTTNSQFSDWIVTTAADDVSIGGNAPATPVEGKSLWLDTTDPTKPQLKLYINSEWETIIPSTVMLTSVYDTENKKEDIYTYLQQALKASVNNIDFDSHINDASMHTTPDEIASWDSKPTMTDLTSSTDSIKTQVTSEAQTVISSQSSKLTALSTAMNTLNSTGSTLNTHAANTTLHPTSSYINSWNNKADPNHTHNADNTVKIYAEKVSVNNKISVDNLSYETKERAYPIDSETALYTITKNPYHNGDMFYIESGTSIQWYFLVDDSLLGTANVANAFKKFITTAQISADWIDIKELPTTLEGYGITDIVSVDDLKDVNLMSDTITQDSPDTNILDKVVDTQTLYTSCVSSIKSINELYTSLNNTLTALEAVLE